jgi:hypothetical protein
VNTPLALRGPGWGWLPQPLQAREYWALVGRFAFFGPLIGGLPYVWLVVTLPFVFGIGLAPALVAGMLYAAWWVIPSPRRPSRLWRAAVGGICGAGGCAVVAVAVFPNNPGIAFMVLAAHGMPAVIVLALATRAEASRTR